jgi:hypothetical protein
MDILKQFFSLKYFLFLISFLSFFIFTVHWRKSIIFLLYFILIEGALRKWFLPSFQKEIFAFKFLILSGIYIGFLRDKKLKGEKIFPPSPLNFLLIIYVIYGLFQIFNPNIKNLLIGLIGFFVEFSPVFLIYLTKEVFDEEEKIYKFIKNYAFFSLPLIIIGFIQYNLSPNHLLNYYAHNVPADAMVGTSVRPSSTFPYISGYAIYLHLISVLLIYILTILDLKIFENIYFLIVFILLNLSVFLTGSRGLFGYVLFTYIIYAFILIKDLKGKMLKFFLPFIFSIFLIFFTPFGKKIYNNFLVRAKGEGYEEVKRRIKIAYIEPFSFAEFSSLFGYGTGMTYQGVGFLKEGEGSFMPQGFESELGRITIEYGIFGLFLTFLFRIVIILLFLKQFLTLKNYKLKYLSLLILLYLFPACIFLDNVNFQAIKGIYFYFFSGFLFLFEK